MGCSHRECILIGGAIVGGAVGLFYAVKFAKRFLHAYRHPYQQVGVVSELYIYPVNSCRGRQVSSMVCTKMGGVFRELRERNFLVMNTETKEFVSARTHPRMVLLDCDVRNAVLMITTVENTPIEVDINKVVDNNKIVSAKLSDDTYISCLDCGDEVGMWLARVLHVEQPLALLYYRGDEPYRIADSPGTPGSPSSPVSYSQEHEAYSEFMPYVAFGAESVSELQSRVEPNSGKEVTVRHFRPNIVVSGCKPFDEDFWMELKIGDVEFECHKPCVRSVEAIVVPSTGERDLDKEPISTLQTYRLAPEGELRKLHKENPIFGVSMRVKNEGEIRVKDVVFARYKTQPF